MRRGPGYGREVFDVACYEERRLDVNELSKKEKRDTGTDGEVEANEVSKMKMEKILIMLVRPFLECVSSFDDT